VTVPDPKQWWRSVFRRAGRDPGLVGYWLLCHRRHEGLKLARLARRLGLDMEGLVLLSLCRTPREVCFTDDLEVICRRTGAGREALALLLRQEQTLYRWRAKPPVQQGWLAAASDAEPPPEPPGEPEPPREPEPEKPPDEQ